jgi:CRP/FNR family transcriptional regulator, dissimilatory nitrate respiration regulator
MIEIMLEYLKILRHIKLSFREGQHLFHRDDRVTSFFLIELGTAQLVRHHPGGSAVVLQRAGPGSVLAEASLFAPDYHCDAIATSPVEASVVSRAAVQQLFRNNQDFAKAWVMHLGKEVRSARLRSEILTLKTVSERVDAWLANHVQLPEKGRWKVLAREIGISPEALYRELAKRL